MFLPLKQVFGIRRLHLLRKHVKNCCVLDIGCGVGQNLVNLSGQIYSGTGIDMDLARLNLANSIIKKLKIKNIKFEHKNIFDYKPKTLFDSVICTEFLEHIKNDNELVKKSNSLLKCNGRIYITVPSKKMLFKFIEKIRDKIGMRDHVRKGYTTGEIQALLEKNNFKVLKLEYHCQFISSFIHYLTVLIGIKKSMTMSSIKFSIKKSSGLFRLYLLIFPLLNLIAKLDLFLPGTLHGGFVFAVGEKQDIAKQNIPHIQQNI